MKLSPLAAGIVGVCVLVNGGALVALVARVAQAAQPTEARSYAADLATMYSEYQRVFTLREACIAAQPAKRGEYAEAYQDWLNRHMRIVDDLENRFAAIVKRASKDQADYSKNYAKHQSEVLQMRESNKKTLLADKPKLIKQCDEYVAFVRHPKSDIPALFPNEFKTVYRPR